MTLLHEPQRVHLALSPLRRRLLEELHEPLSATQAADLLGVSRQQANYHLRVLEGAGLVELVETRRRRGCTERILRATAGAFVVDPGVVGTQAAASDDRYAAEHLVATAADVVRDVVRMQGAADGAGTRLLTFTIEADIGFRQPGDVEAFTTALADAVAAIAHRFHDPAGRRYRVVAGGHPARTEGPTT